MIKGKTKTGFEYRLQDYVLDDFEVLELVGAVDEGNLTALSKLLTALLGDEQKKVYLEHVKSIKKTHISTEVITEDIKALFENLSEEPETKNS